MTTPTPARSAQIIVARGIHRALEVANNKNILTRSLGTVHRSYGELNLELKLQPDQTRIDVTPNSAMVRHYDRESQRYEVLTSVAIRHKFKSNSMESDGSFSEVVVDEMMDLCQEVFDYFCPSQPDRPEGRVLPSEIEGAENARWEEGGSIEAPYEQYLSQFQMFLGILRIKYVIAMVPCLHPDSH